MAPLLRARGYEVLDGHERAARRSKRVERDKPDLVVLDLGLPDIDGVEVCRLIRETHERADPRAVGARRREATRSRALDAGADDYVTKPFGAEELLARIRVALRRVEPPRRRASRSSRGDLVIDRERFRVLARRRGSAPDAEGVRAADLPGAASRPGADAPRDPEGDLGSECRRSARASARARRRRCARRSSPTRRRPATSSPSRGSAIGSWTSMLRPIGCRIERQVELQHVDARLAEEPECRPSVCAATSARTSASRHPALARDARHLEVAAAGDRCGSSPEADVVTRSMGTGTSPDSPSSRPRRSPSRARSASCSSVRAGCRPSSRRRSRCRPPTAATGNSPATRSAWPMMREPTTVPLRSISWPLALSGNTTCAMPGDRQRVDDAEQQRGDDGHQRRRSRGLRVMFMMPPTPVPAP